MQKHFPHSRGNLQEKKYKFSNKSDSKQTAVCRPQKLRVSGWKVMLPIVQPPKGLVTDLWMVHVSDQRSYDHELGFNTQWHNAILASYLNIARHMVPKKVSSKPETKSKRGISWILRSYSHYKSANIFVLSISYDTLRLFKAGVSEMPFISFLNRYYSFK